MGCSLSGVGSHRSIATSLSRKYRAGRFSRTLALPGQCDIEAAQASFENGIVRIVLPRHRQRVAHTIKVEVGKGKESSRIVMEGPEVVDAVKGQGYREVESKSNRRKRRLK